jgi:hypothetical protein
MFRLKICRGHEAIVLTPMRLFMLQAIHAPYCGGIAFTMHA